MSVWPSTAKISKALCGFDYPKLKDALVAFLRCAVGVLKVMPVVREDGLRPKALES